VELIGNDGVVPNAARVLEKRELLVVPSTEQVKLRRMAVDTAHMLALVYDCVLNLYVRFFYSSIR